MGGPPTGVAGVATVAEDPSAVHPVPSGGSPMSRAWEIGGLRPGRAAQARLRIAADGEGLAPELETQTPMSSEPPRHPWAARMNEFGNEPIGAGRMSEFGNESLGREGRVNLGMNLSGRER